MKSLFIILLILDFLFSSCSHVQDNSNNDTEPFNLSDTTKAKFTFLGTKDAALDALDQIQVSGWNLYSTFPNIEHGCSESVSTFKISKEEFENALLDLLNQYYQKLSVDERTDLAFAASKSENEYIVTICGPTTESLTTKEKATLPRKGIWIFQAFLDQRDLVIEW